MTKRRKKSKTQFLNSPENLTDEHILRIAHQAVAKARIPSEVIPYEDCLDIALMGIARGYEKFNRDKNGEYNPYANWGSKIRPWLSMQALFAIRDEAKKRRIELSRQTLLEETEFLEDQETLTPLDEMIQEERTQAAETLLSCLKKQDRDIVRRICIFGESIAHVAKRFRLKRKEVEKRYNDSLDYLRSVSLAAYECLKKTDK